MIDVTKFKPDLIANNPKDGSFDIHAKIIENGGYLKYLATFKKDGCRLQIQHKVLTRTLKEPKKVIRDKFQPLADMCKELNIFLDGEFWSEGMKLNEVFRFFTNEDVTRPEVRAKLEKLYTKSPEEFSREYGDRSVEWLCTFHDSLKFYLFDGIVLDRPDLVGYEERITEIIHRVSSVWGDAEIVKLLVPPTYEPISSRDELDSLYERALKEKYEGLVLTHIYHNYKFGRNTLKAGTILKMKDDAVEYDAVVLGVEEATSVKEGVSITINELGRSVTSKKKGDREPSGKAKGFLVQFGEVGTFTVQLQGFNDEKRREVFENPEKYIGRHFKYTAMKPDKDFPRSAFFYCWRDEK